MRLITIVTCWLIVSASVAASVGSRVDNFRLMDHLGQSHELYYYRDAKAVALFIHDAACQSEAETFVGQGRDFLGHGVELFMLNSTPHLSRQALASTGIDVPILLDGVGIIGQSLAAVTPGEVLVIDPGTWQVVYRGGAGESAGKGFQSALSDLVDSQPVQTQTTDWRPCGNATRPVMVDTDVPVSSYADDVAPILLEKCVSCHREGGIGSWAMSDYNMVRGFSLMMREVIRTKRMPPWHADNEIGHWSNDRSLTDQEVQTIVGWIEAGAPWEGGTDPLAEAELDYPTWEIAGILGEPDYVIELPATEIPATGVMDYLDVYVDNPIEQDVWVQAAEIRPGDRTVLHHTITTYGERSWFDRLIGDISKKGALRHYAPGITNRPFPENTGVLLPADSTFEFQMHYTTTGKATVDRTKVGIWVYDEAPAHSMQSFFIQNRRINIPAHAANHREEKTVEIPKDALLYSLLPHAHYRGKAAEFLAIYPDGTEEVLLSVPNYDFNWQTAYEFSEPKFVPAGTRLVQSNWWDNSARNPANPDPSQAVAWGDQSWEEMLFGEVTLRFLDEDEALRYANVVSSK